MSAPNLPRPDWLVQNTQQAWLEQVKKLLSSGTGKRQRFSDEQLLSAITRYDNELGVASGWNSADFLQGYLGFPSSPADIRRLYERKERKRITADYKQAWDFIQKTRPVSIKDVEKMKADQLCEVLQRGNLNSIATQYNDLTKKLSDQMLKILPDYVQLQQVDARSAAIVSEGPTNYLNRLFDLISITSPVYTESPRSARYRSTGSRSSGGAGNAAARRKLLAEINSKNTARWLDQSHLPLLARASDVPKLCGPKELFSDFRQQMFQETQPSAPSMFGGRGASSGAISRGNPPLIRMPSAATGAITLLGGGDIKYPAPPVQSIIDLEPRKKLCRDGTTRNTFRGNKLIKRQGRWVPCTDNDLCVYQPACTDEGDADIFEDS